jgi:hypothetical protein
MKEISQSQMKNENVAKEQMPLPTQTNALNICPFFSVR